jgi:MFS family permease
LIPSVKLSGWASIIGAAGAYGLGHIKTKALHSYQIIFLVGGLLTVLSAPVIYWKLDNHVAEAKFLSPEDRLKAVERLKANQTGLGSKEFKVSHVVEAMLEPRTWGWMVMALIVNVGGNVGLDFLDFAR